MRIVLVLLAAACGFEHGSASRDGGIPGDGDALIDMLDAFDPNCFGKPPFAVCLQKLPTDPLTLPTNINTSDTGGSHCVQIGGEVVPVGGVETCVLAGTDVTASGVAIGVTGSRPLVVAALGTLTVSTTNFDVTSGSGGNGPNANPADCAPVVAMNGGSENGGGGGGAGGSFGAQGGNGGSGSAGAAARGMAKAADTSFDKLRGGCAGGDGGAGQSGTAAGGSGGGAIYLVSRDVLSITGIVNASGAGGIGGMGPRGGGGGGGSGGMIVLFANNLSVGVAGRLIANGGGGGGGAGNSAFDGGNGTDATLAEPGAPGGIAGDSQGTDGGAGGFKSTDARSAMNAAQGGGGGGGAVGVIRILSGQSVAPINTSPTPVQN